ncbi:MAG TPA: TetR/AcrR family transcriptional regulator [Solirubrobacterales bacterium]|nr:TetR/AcrR family transcriptional regulator [Solirubrobacterales bacterium]
MEAASKSRDESRRRISGDERRESILQLTSRAFAERGYDGVRTAELAESAGVSEALIYQHFRTKAELYRAAVDRSADIFGQRMSSAVPPNADVEAGLRSGIDTFLSFVAEPDNAWTVLTLTVSDPELAEYQRELRGRATGALADLLALDPRAAGSGLERAELEQLAEVIAGGAEALATWWAQNPNATRAELVDLLMGFVWSGFDRLVDSSSSRR